MSSLISIIIPIYNTQDYLTRCLESVINQTYENLEIILINDGSTDDSLYLCEIFAKKDNRIILINKKNNTGQALSRNKALDIAKGEYISFIDSDDWIPLDYIKNLYLNLKKYDADISASSPLSCKVGNINLEPEKIIIFDDNYKVMEAFLKGKLSSMTCGSLIKYQIIGSFRFRNFIAYEDLDFFYRIYAKAEIVVKSHRTRYFYYQRADSIMGNNRLKFSLRHLDTLKLITADYESFLIKEYPMFGSNIYMNILRHIVDNFADEFTGKNELSKEILKLYRALYFNCMKVNYKLSLPYKLFFLFPKCTTLSYLFLKKLKLLYKRVKNKLC
ncbi:glycosyltransferase family 2 protein [Francisella philomiragia]|uniref:glycosyltransferase family 2 protein n=1 Tax=Francisella philomiragia TaxID=28110 RepID=UPI001C9D9D73|nr:glycosyltransferase family 2 protein [Francisella philomiragia]MBY7733839.1 glycosyltransferase [Francisella philomiragia]